MSNRDPGSRVQYNETLHLKKVELGKTLRIALKDATAKKGSRTHASTLISVANFAEPTAFNLELQPSDLTKDAGTINVSLKLSISRPGAKGQDGDAFPRQQSDSQNLPEEASHAPVSAKLIADPLSSSQTNETSAPAVSAPSPTPAAVPPVHAPPAPQPSASRDELRAEVEALHTQIEVLKAENISLKAQLLDAHTAETAQRAKMDALTYTNSDLKTRWLETQRDNLALHTQLEDALKHNEEYKVQLAALTSSVDKLMFKVEGGSQIKPKAGGLFKKMSLRDASVSDHGAAAPRLASSSLSADVLTGPPSTAPSPWHAGLDSHAEEVGHAVDDNAGEDTPSAVVVPARPPGDNPFDSGDDDAAAGGESESNGLKSNPFD